MSEEAKQTTSESQSSSTTQAAETQTNPLEKVYKDFNVDSMAQEFSAKPQPRQEQRQETNQVQHQEQTVGAPDPILDKAGFDRFLSRMNQVSAADRQALQQMRSEFAEYRRSAAMQVEEADIRKAVSKVNDHLGDAKLPEDFLEVALGVEAKRDKRFLTIWENRTKNPQAFDAALKAVAGKLGKTYSLRADPQIAENQRALREATSTKATTAPEQSRDDKLAALPPAQFQRAMARIREGLDPFG